MTSWEKSKSAIARVIRNDLIRTQRLVARGVPTSEEIERYSQEAAELLEKGYLKSLCHGFQRDGKWILAIQLAIASPGNAEATQEDYFVSCAFPKSIFFSYLAYSSKWGELPLAQQNKFKKSVNIEREPALAPAGIWSPDKVYEFADIKLERKWLKR